MKITIIEDDENVASFIKENLSKENYQLEVLSTSQELVQFIENKESSPSLIILDRLIGNVDTLYYFRDIKRSHPDSMVLVLSAINAPNDKATLLDMGADDYLGKPFSLMELQARVRALMRRDKRAQSFFMNIGDLVVDLKSRSVICNGNKIQLKNKEYSLLINFAQAPFKVFTKYQLMDIIWESNLEIESNVLEVTIMNLRKRLESSGSSVVLQSKRNIGYWLET